MIKSKKLSVVLFILIMIVGLAACGRKNADKNDSLDKTSPSAAPSEDAAATEAPEATPTPAPPRNLNGIKVVVGDWWSTGEVTENKLLSNPRYNGPHKLG